MKNRPHTTENEIAELTKRQHGYVTRRQLLQLGLGEGAIRARIRQGRLIRVYAGVYAVGHVPALALDRAHGALLACGGQAVLSHSSAGAVWKVYERFETPFEVTVPGPRRRPGIRVHRAALAGQDIRRSRGLPVTSPARTLLDLAPRLTPRALERAIDDMRRAGYVRPPDLADILTRYVGHHGAAKIRLVGDPGHSPTRSDLELDFIAFVKRFDLPMPLINAKIGRHEVDALFGDERVIVELDSWGFHGSRTSFRSDRKRDAELLTLGYVTVRITWERLRYEPDQVAAELRSILAQRAFLRSAG